MAGEETLRFLAFAIVFLLMAAWEWAAPRRGALAVRRLRWRTNLSLGVVNQLLLRALSPALLLSVAARVQDHGWGVLNQFAIAPPIAGLIAFLSLDLTIYFQHRLFHRVPWLWRLHRVHHSDVDFDVTTAVRFHPLEAFTSMLVKIAAVVLLGPPLLAVLAFELALSLSALFSHGNVSLPLRIDRGVRRLLVTPDMHRVHHSCRSEEMRANFGFNLSWWDRLLGTYRDQPVYGHVGMRIGLREFREPESLRLPGLLSQPFMPLAASSEDPG